MMEMWGTVEQLTAETSWAPILMLPACSALGPTMKPVVLWRKMMGVFLTDVSWMRLLSILLDKRGGGRGELYSWLQSRMNCAVFAASLGLMMGVWLATIPTGNPVK